MPRYSKKKRKGFFGSRPQDSDSQPAHIESSDNVEAGGTRNEDETSTTPKTSKSAVPMKKLKNMSAENILNTDFNNFNVER